MFARTAGVPLLAGNAVQLLRDAAENYPAWLEAIQSAEHFIHCESYILHEDAQGQQFAALLVAKARAGGRVIYDWVGGLGATSQGFWQQLRAAGAEVRRFNPLRLDSPFGWLNRDHRKRRGVDGRRAFVSGLCVGEQWVGEPERGVASQLLVEHFQSADLRLHLGRTRTYPGVLPLLHLDHIYYDAALALEAATLHGSRTALLASDHLPLVAEFHLRGDKR
jgi:phosphatidylserine/phosphatidylglycerophosphate/cardiolipin synthase-like enzyme